MGEGRGMRRERYLKLTNFEKSIKNEYISFKAFVKKCKHLKQQNIIANTTQGLLKDYGVIRLYTTLTAPNNWTDLLVSLHLLWTIFC